MDAHSALPAEPHPGERWVLRRRLADGSATDVVGWVEAVGPESIIVGLLGGERVPVDRRSLIVARRAPAALGGPDPARTSPAELERYALTGWLALRRPLGEWTLRAAGGFTGRANSCLAVGDPGMPVAQAAEVVVAWSREQGIRPWAQVVVGSAEESDLAGLGWRPAYLTTDVMVARLASFLGDGLPDPRVGVGEILTQAWLDAYQRSRPNDADPGLLRMILDGNPPRAFASVGGDRLVAIARGHVNGPWLGLASIWTSPDGRRQGLATAMMRALGHWGARRGARQVYLQVAAPNTDAVAAYRRLGFAYHHSYHVLEAPAAG